MNVSDPSVRPIGRSDLKIAPIGVGTWQWGDRRYWGYGESYDEPDLEGAFEAALEAGLNFFDTAEIYGGGESERLLGRRLARSDGEIVVASKYMPAPNRFTGRALERAVDASLERLGVDRIDLYQIHWPFSIVSHRPLMRALAGLVRAGKVSWVGVSNYGARRLRRAHSTLAEYGVELVSNQVKYSLIDRSPEINGVLEACRELDVTLIAYSPLGQGLLSAKYDENSQFSGWRRRSPGFSKARRLAMQPLLEALREIATMRERTPAQVALNWLVRRPGIVAIPGAKNAEQVAQNAGALGWSLTEAEAGKLDSASLPWRKRGLLDRIL